jgi:hypothetical protein
MLPVDVAEALRKENFERLTNHLRGGPTEDRFCTVVEHQDSLFVVDRDDGVGSDADYSGELVLDLLAFGLVDARLDEVGRTSVRAADPRVRPGDPPSHAGLGDPVVREATRKRRGL